MPTFDNISVQATVDFEVYCGTCGAGLCSESDTRCSRNRGYAQVTVNACPYCIEKKDREIHDLLETIKELKFEISSLNTEIILLETSNK